MCLVCLNLATEALRHDDRPDHPVLVTLSKFRGVFRTQSNIYDGAFFEKIVIKYFAKKIHRRC